MNPFNPLKLLRHANRVEASLRGEIVFPISVELDLSNTCPHDCPFCSFGTSASQGYRQQNWVQFDTPKLVALMTELRQCDVRSLTFTGGGEPLVHKEIGRILTVATNLGFEWGVVTNGYLLRAHAAEQIARHATFVRISLDAGTPETHAFTHGLPGPPQFDAIIENIAQTRRLAEAAGHPLTIGASFCVMDQNWAELYRAASLVKKVGANYLEVRPTFPTDWRGDGWGSALSSANVDAARKVIADAKAALDAPPDFQIIGMIDRFDALDAPAKKYAKCRIGDLMTVIGADGRGWHCCVQRGQDYFTYGSVTGKEGFKQVWLDRRRQEMIAGIDVTQCPRCRYDGYNELIEKAFLGDSMHRNFV